MRIFFIFFSLFLMSTYLGAYSTKIVIGTFKSDYNAKRLVEKLPTTISNYDELSQLLKEDDVIIHVRKVGNYHLVLAEIFSNKTIAEKSLQIIKYKFKNAYINEAPSEESMQEKAKEIQKLKEEVAILKKKKEVVEKIKEIKIENVEKESLLRSALRYINIYFLIVFILLMALIYYLVGIKEKYDEY